MQFNKALPTNRTMNYMYTSNQPKDEFPDCPAKNLSAVVTSDMGMVTSHMGTVTSHTGMVTIHTGMVTGHTRLDTRPGISRGGWAGAVMWWAGVLGEPYT